MEGQGGVRGAGDPEDWTVDILYRPGGEDRRERGEEGIPVG